jgi:cephalosporin hydroxylase
MKKILIIQKVFQRIENMPKIQNILQQSSSIQDYVSANFSLIQPDECFPNMIVGDTNLQPWSYLRREVPHKWYVDKRQPTVGFLSRDEAHILYNTALKLKGKKALEIGCWLGWSACHLALAGVELDIVDPLLAIRDFYESVSNSLKSAGVIDSVNLVAGSSPQAVEELASQLQRKWSLIFIDGNHEAPGPLHDAIICEQLAEKDALILFHDLASPDVAQGLEYFKQKGWQTMVYQTMQIMGVAWRGNVEPVIHQPDPKVNWVLPAHLQTYTVSNMSNNQFIDREITVRQVQAMMQEAVALLNTNKPVEAMRIAEQAVLLNINVPGMHYLRSICLNNVGRHKEALAAAKSELAINPTHRQAQEQVERLTQALLRSEITIPTQQRSWNTALARENMLSIQNASMNYSYRGVPMIKNPFDFALYPVLIWNLKPATIIEIGSKDGGSALWLGDMLNNFDIEGHIYSIDIVKVTSVQHPRVTYMEGNGRVLQETFTPNFLNSLPRPLLIIEDADHSYETSKHVLDFFNSYLKQGEYIVIEDGIISDLIQDTSYNVGPHKALKEFLSEHEDEYEIDSTYCDYFGYNITWCTNGFLKKAKESSSVSKAFLNNKSLVDSEKSFSEELSEFVDNLSLREINIIIFPDWKQPEEDLFLHLELLFKTLLTHPDRNKITALLDTTNILEEDANLIISSVVMNILLQADLDETDVPEISLLGQLSQFQWAALIPHILYRVVLDHENQQNILQVGAEKLPIMGINNLTKINI